jgi:outer membrane protein assembly factor BamB
MAADWPTQSGSPQRDGWAKSETGFTRENAKGLELLYKYKAENQSRGADALTTPIINTRIITYLGFKEELVFGGSSDHVFAVDADLNRIIWKTHFDYRGEKPQAAATALCPGGMTASVVMNGSSTATAGRGGGGAPGAPGIAGGRGLPNGAVGRGQMIPPGRMGGPGAGQPRGGNRSGEYFAVSADGYLHTLNTSTGQDRVEARKFLPANAKVGPTNIVDNTLYAATLDGCGGNANALYAFDLSPEGKVVSVPMDTAGVAIGSDGAVYAQAGKSVVAMAPKTLEVKGRFEGAAGRMLPVVFSWHEKDAVLAGTSDGRLILLDSGAMATPLLQTEPQGEGFEGAFASWLDAASGTRWIYAATATHILGYRLEDQAGKPVLTQVWKSKEMKEPAAPVTANGLVFALSTGGRAVLSLMDGATGAELYNSGTIAATGTHNSGLAVANKRVYFTTHDNTVYCFGFFADQPQLTGR